MNGAEARELLAVDANASPREMKYAYHSMLKLWHPDRFPYDSPSYPEAIRQTQRINAAYRLLAEDGVTLDVEQNLGEACAVYWQGRPIRTVDWKWWPLRTIASDGTSIPVGVLTFALAYASLMGLTLLILTALGLILTALGLRP